MKSILLLLALVTLAYGLWTHDWTTIIASFAVAVMWPLLEKDVHDREQMLDRLWDDDDDLKDSC